MEGNKGIVQKFMVCIWSENLQKRNIFLRNYSWTSKEKRIVIRLICSVALNASFCLKKRKLRKNESEVFRVKIPQRKVTKCNTYHNSFFFIVVLLQFSIKFCFSGCLVLITTNKLVISVGKRRGFSRRLWELIREKFSIR